VIEMGPVVEGPEGTARGVVAEGSVGVQRAGRMRFFGYEIRCWRDGVTA
jgi:hypothetical protein